MKSEIVQTPKEETGRRQDLFESQVGKRMKNKKLTLWRGRRLYRKGG